MLTRKHYDSLTEDKDKAGSKKVNKSGHVQKVTVTTKTEYERVLLQPSERRRSTGHKINSQIEKYKPLWKCWKRFIPPQTDIQGNFQVMKQQQQQQIINRLYKEQTSAPHVFYSVSVRTLTEQHKQKVNKKKSLPSRRHFRNVYYIIYMSPEHYIWGCIQQRSTLKNC